MEENTKGVTFMKKSLLLVSLSLSLLIALSGCNKDVKVSEIDVENKPVSRSIAVEPTAEEDTLCHLLQKKTPSSHNPSLLQMPLWECANF